MPWITEHYKSREARDKRFAELRVKYSTCDVFRDTSRNQELHPMYVSDVGSSDTGIGNTAYKTFWPRLYNVHVRDPRA
jgi:hypothetical protein